MVFQAKIPFITYYANSKNRPLTMNLHVLVDISVGIINIQSSFFRSLRLLVSVINCSDNYIVIYLVFG